MTSGDRNTNSVKPNTGSLARPTLAAGIIKEVRPKMRTKTYNMIIIRNVNEKYLSIIKYA